MSVYRIFIAFSLFCFGVAFSSRAQQNPADLARAKARYDSEHNALMRQVAGEKEAIPDRPHAVIVHRTPSVADRKSDNERVMQAVRESRENLDKLHAPSEALHRKKLIGRIIYYSAIGLIALFIYLSRKRKSTNKNHLK